MAESIISEIVCRVCGQPKQRNEFYTRNKIRPHDGDGLIQPCIECHKVQSRIAGKKHRDAVRLSRPKHYCQCGCGAEVASRQIKYVRGHQKEKKCLKCGEVKPIESFLPKPPRLRANGELAVYRDSYCVPCKNEYTQALPGRAEKRRAYMREYNKTERGKLNKRLNRQKHADTHRARCARWVAANPEKRRLAVMISEHKRRLNGWHKHSPNVREAIEYTLESYRIGDKYWDVYDSCLIDKPTVDHIQPISKGGDNEADNLCVTSLANNSSKCDDTLLVWLVKRAQRNAA